MVEQREIRLVEIDQRQHADGDADAGHDVDEEQPVPRHRVGDVAADGRADGRRQRRDQADDRARRCTAAPRKHQIGRGEHGRDHAGAEKPWIARHRIICSIEEAEAAHQAGEREAGGRDREQHAACRARATGSRTAGSRSPRRSDRRSAPRRSRRRGRQAGLDFGQRRRDDLDVQDRHEHAEHHDQEREQPARRDARRSGAAGRPSCGRRRCAVSARSVAAVMASLPSGLLRARHGACAVGRLSGRCAGARRLGIDGDDDRHAGRSRFCRATSSGTADAHRQPLHDLGEIAGGVVRRQQREHRARGRRDARRPCRRSRWPAGVDGDRHRLAGTDPLQLRLLEIGVDDRRRRAAPRLRAAARPATKSPVWTRRLENMPSTGARIDVNDRSRSALASEVCNSASCAPASSCCALVTSTLSRAASMPACAPSPAATPGRARLRTASKVARRQIPWRSAPAGGRNRARPASVPASAETSCAFACSTAPSGRGDLAADALDGGLLGRDLGARGVDRDPIVAVVDPEDHVAGTDRALSSGRNAGDVAGHPRASVVLLART